VTIVQAIRIQTIAALATYTESKPIIQWSIVEINMGVLVGCVPALSPLLKSFGRKVSYNSRSKSGAYGAKSGGGGIAYGQSQRGDAATGPRTPARKSRVLVSSRDDEEMELCETKDGWLTDSHSTRVRTVGGTDDGDSYGRSRTSSPYGPQQHITVVHEYTVQHTDA
jgi:hypothetical protein